MNYSHKTLMTVTEFDFAMVLFAKHAYFPVMFLYAGLIARHTSVLSPSNLDKGLWFQECTSQLF